MKHAFNRGVLSSKMAVSLVSGSLCLAAGQAWALTAAGTDIKNKATVTYEDANGNSYTAQSNESVVTVAEVYAATLQNDGDKAGAPGETVYFPHTLENTGNTADTYVVDGLDGAGTAGAYDVYLDANGNGMPDAGESVVSTVSLSAGEQAELIVAVPVPSGTAAGTTIDATLLAQATQGDGSFDGLTTDGGLVTDIGTNGDAASYDADGDGTADGNDTNSNTVTVSTDAVLVTNKSASVDEATNTITYTLTVKNNGGSAATGVEIYDAIPANSSFVDVTAVNGLLASNGDTYEDAAGAAVSIPSDPTTMYDPGTLATVDEPAGVDMDGDGVTGETGIPGISLTDATLGVNTTVSVVYSVTYDPTAPAGTEVKNTFAAAGDLDGDGITDEPVTSNTTTTTIAQTYGAIVDDTEVGADTTDDDTYNVASAASGAVVDFFHTVSNTGNGTDTYELAIDTSSFPTGTTYTFWNAAGTVQLTDTNGDGNPDTGALAAGDVFDFAVKVDLPAGESGTGPYSYTLSATSAGDATQADTTQGVLGSITAPAVDLANSATASGLNDDGSVDADPFTAGAPVVTQETTVGGTVAFDLFVANESGSSQSYLLEQSLPAGWSVVYKEVGIDSDGDGVLDNTTNAGDVVSATPNLPAGAVYHYSAEVTVSSDVAEALADYTGGDAVDGNADADGDYPITFTVVSATDGTVTDSTLDAVDITADRNISLTPDGANQIQPGGSVDYSHVLSNDGNSTETVELTATNSGSADGWTNTTQVLADVDGDGTFEWTSLSDLPTGTIAMKDPAGNTVTVEVADADGDGNPELTLEPGEQVEIRTTVFAPANAAEGTTDTLTLSATTSDGLVGSATDVSEVVLGQVRLDKSAALDTDCSCASDWTAETTFEATQSSQVEPGECIIWQLTATNEGSAAASNVVITDETTPYTTFVAANDAVRNSDGAVTSNTGTAPVVEWQVGDLPAGDSATAQFCVKVD